MPLKLCISALIHEISSNESFEFIRIWHGVAFVRLSPGRRSFHAAIALSPDAGSPFHGRFMDIDSISDALLGECRR
jgi:hypothetical protein